MPAISQKEASSVIPDIQNGERPVLDKFTEDEFKKTPITVHGKVLKNQAEWHGWADVADEGVRQYRKYIAGIFNVKDPYDETRKKEKKRVKKIKIEMKEE